MKILSVIFIMMFTSVAALAEGTDALIANKIKAVSGIYADGYAALVAKSVKHRTLKYGNSCVNMASFFMEGFSGGNNSAQFLLFLTCEPGKNGELNVLGVHPSYQHRNVYDLNSAIYEDKLITIESPKGSITFTREYSIWWSAAEQIGN